MKACSEGAKVFLNVVESDCTLSKSLEVETGNKLRDSKWRDTK